MQAVILSAGSGMRLWPLTREFPKCLTKVRDKTLLEYQLEHLSRFGVNKVVVTVQRRHEQVTKSATEKMKTAIWRWPEKPSFPYPVPDIVLSVEDEILGTAGGLRKALNLIEDNNILVMNADDLADIDVNELFKLGAPAICITMPRSNFGVVRVDSNKVKSFEEKPILPYYTSVGWYYLPKDIPLPQKGMLEEDVFPQMANEGNLKAHYHHGFWVTVNTPKDIKEVETFFKSKEETLTSA